jgi:enhancer of polycomb-like protein
MATRKVRYKKLNIKTPLPVLTEDQLDSTEYEAITAETRIATGVEQAEENVSTNFTYLAPDMSRGRIT